MTNAELLDHPAIVVLIGAVVSFLICFVVAWIYIARRIVRVFKILFHMEKLGYKRSPCGIWTRERMAEVLKAADKMPTLGSEKMDATRQKLREQSDSPVFGWLLATLALLFLLMIAFAAVVTGRAVVVLALLPAGIMFLAFHHAIKCVDNSLR